MEFPSPYRKWEFAETKEERQKYAWQIVKLAREAKERLK
jgi:hypothetical protein